MTPRSPRLLLLSGLAGVALVGIFAAMVAHYHSTLRAETRRTIIDRDAAVLHPFVLRQLSQRQPGPGTEYPVDALATLLEGAKQKNILAMVIFDAEGRTVRYAPDSLLFAELPLDDYAQLLKAKPISRYHPSFPIERYFAGFSPADARPATPVLEVLLPLHGNDPAKILGFAQYFIDARPLTNELALIDERMSRLTSATLGIGALLIVAVVTVAYFKLRRAQQLIAERNSSLVRANIELSLAAKASALGQITSHLMHGLQGSVAGLRAVVNEHESGLPASDWDTAAAYTQRMQTLIQETIVLLGDSSAQTSYELTGHELATIVQQRNAEAAEKKGVRFKVHGGFDANVDSHRGGLICLIANNLIQNAIEATAPGRNVTVNFSSSNTTATLTIADEGHGIPPEQRVHLFEPGRSRRAGGSGLGLAISQLIARQIGATLELDSSGPTGTTFRLTLPLLRQ